MATKQVSAKTQAANPDKYTTSQINPALAGGTAKNPKGTPTGLSTSIDTARYNAGGGVISPYQTTISSQNMQPNPEVKLPLPIIPQGTAQAQGAVNASVEASKQQQAQSQEEAQLTAQNQQNQQPSQVSKGLQEIFGINEQIAGAESTIDRTAEKAKQAETNRLASEIEQEQLAVTNQINELRRTNPQGVFGGALEDQIRDIERESLIRQTQKAVLLNAANRDYESAVANTKLELDLKLKPLQAKLENAKLFYQENKELFNKQDERAYKERISKEEREYNKIEKTETALQQTRSKLLESAVSQGAPSSVVKGIMSAESPEEAITAAGQYSANILDISIKKAQLNKLRADARNNDTVSSNLSEKQLGFIDRSPQGKKLQVLSDLNTAMSTYKGLVDQFGFQAIGKNKTLIDNAYADAQIKWKEAAGLGALTGPDVGFIGRSIKPSAGGAIDFIENVRAGGKAGVSAGLDQALASGRNSALKEYKQLVARDPAYSGSEYVRAFITPFAKDAESVGEEYMKTAPVGEIIMTPDGNMFESLGGGNYSPL